MKRCLIMHKDDHVATALEALHGGESAAVYSSDNQHLQNITAVENIPCANKIAMQDIQPGEEVHKYGIPIGTCTSPIRKGELVHVHNIKSLTVDIPQSIRKEIMLQMGIKMEGY